MRVCAVEPNSVAIASGREGGALTVFLSCIFDNDNVVVCDNLGIVALDNAVSIEQDAVGAAEIQLTVSTEPTYSTQS